jgi:hypothetical protein
MLRPHATDSAYCAIGSGWLGVRRVSLPAGGDRAGGAVVPAVRPVLPGRGGTLADRGIDVDHVTVHRWVGRFAPLLADAARFGRHRVGERWHVDETYPG